jgi:hypothetical protein
LVVLRYLSFGRTIRSLCPDCNSPSPKITIGDTEMTVIITIEAVISKHIVESDKQAINGLLLTFIAQLFLNLDIIYKIYEA